MEDGTERGARKPWSKWNADTERAFLLALRLTGQVRKAADAIGRSRSAAQTRRRTNPEFAAAWDAVIAEQQAEWIAAAQARLGPGLDGAADREGGGRLTPWRDKKGGWDARKRGLFLRTLARTKSVSQACAAAGMSDSAAYYLRGQSPRFAAAWERALRDETVPSVIEAAIERAVNGWDEVVYRGGVEVSRRRRYSDSLLRLLLQRALGERRAGTGRSGAAGQGDAAAPRIGARSSKNALIAHAQAAAAAAGGILAFRGTREEAEKALLHKLDILAIRLEREKEAQERGG